MSCKPDLTLHAYFILCLSHLGENYHVDSRITTSSDFSHEQQLNKIASRAGKRISSLFCMDSYLTIQALGSVHCLYPSSARIQQHRMKSQLRLSWRLDWKRSVKVQFHQRPAFNTFLITVWKAWFTTSKGVLQLRRVWSDLVYCCNVFKHLTPFRLLTPA